MTSKRPAAGPASLPCKALVQNRQRRFKIFSGSVEAFCAGILATLEMQGQVLSVTFVGPRKMRALNEKHRGRDYPTDVLSFSYREEFLEGHCFLGEIVISPWVAWSQARRFNVSPEREMRKLLVHGILHLLGYDHETDNGEMNQLERRLARSRTFRASDPVADMRSAR